MFKPLAQLRDLRADQYGLRTFLVIDEVPITLEIVREARIAEKLLANVDRVNDPATFNRDAIDLGMMVDAAYGDAVEKALAIAVGRLGDERSRFGCATGLGMSGEDIDRALVAQKSISDS